MLLLRLLLWEGAGPAEEITYEAAPGRGRWRAPGPRAAWAARDGQVAWAPAAPGVAWRAGGREAVTFATLEHLAGWSRRYDADFSQFAEIAAGQTITAVTSWAWPAGITASAPAIAPSGAVVQVRLSGAAAALDLPEVLCVVVTSGGDTLSQKTPLKVVV